MIRYCKKQDCSNEQSCFVFIGAFVVVICEKTLQYFRSLINCIDILSYIIKNVYSNIEIYKILFVFR